MRKDQTVLTATKARIFSERKADGWYIEGATYRTLSKPERDAITEEALRQIAFRNCV